MQGVTFSRTQSVCWIWQRKLRQPSGQRENRKGCSRLELHRPYVSIVFPNCYALFEHTIHVFTWSSIPVPAVNCVNLFVQVVLMWLLFLRKWIEKEGREMSH